MNKVERIKQVFERFEYELLQENESFLVYAAGHNLYLGVEIVSFIDKDSDLIKKLVEEYRAANYSVRVCTLDDADSIEVYLFDWFFQVEFNNKRISIDYKLYSDAVLSAYGLESLQDKRYEYITCPYSVEKNIKGILNERGQTTMSEIVKQYPLEKGLPELFAYFGVLNHFPHKSINTEKHQFIVFDYEHNKRILIPEIIISR